LSGLALAAASAEQFPTVNDMLTLAPHSARSKLGEQVAGMRLLRCETLWRRRRRRRRRWKDWRSSCAQMYAI